GFLIQSLVRGRRADVVCEFVHRSAIQHGRHDIITRCGSHPAARQMEQGEIFGVAIYIAQQDVEQSDAYKLETLAGGIDGTVEDVANGRHVEAVGATSWPLIFVPCRQTQGLAEVLLMNARYDTLFDAPVEPLNEQCRDAVDLYQTCWRRLEASGCRSVHRGVFTHRVALVAFLGHFENVRGRRAGNRLGVAAIWQDGNGNLALHSGQRGGVVQLLREWFSAVERPDDRHDLVIFIWAIVLLKL